MVNSDWLESGGEGQGEGGIMNQRCPLILTSPTAITLLNPIAKGGGKGLGWNMLGLHKVADCSMIHRYVQPVHAVLLFQEEVLCADGA